MIYFNQERAAYYRAKKRELKRKSDADRVVRDDARYIRHYGMSAFLELFPEAKGFGISWHQQVVEELESMQKRETASLLSGIYMANAATKNKKANRKFRRVIKDLFRR